MAEGWQPVVPLDTEDPERAPQRRPRDPVALVAGIVFAVLAVLLMSGLSTPFLLFGDGGLVWLLLLGAGVALLVAELRKAGRRAAGRR